ncbi:sulfatase-like hydrolase/transferase [Cohnella sp. WQ 127256]|uniref:sulfatase-like hydrolase/transferase n=1 Tax=Cohnella sp. WQ 127256 TaxID=2938790 RepID=UPI0021176C4F|nr:sulfatase-like hydrolase/transferase [Cohnella sp. WQ 127256]
MERKPNVVFFFSDQQRWDTLGCYGQKLNITPNLDRLAELGVRFENAFTCQPVCAPARACVQTGKYGTETGCYKNDIALPLDEKTLAHYFIEAGYEVAYVGKWHLASQGRKQNYSKKPIPLERRGGYNGYYRASEILEFTSHGYNGYVHDEHNNKIKFKGYRADCITDFALDFIRNRRDDKPFFLFLSHIEPHHQNDRFRYEGPRGSKQMFRNFEAPGDLVGQRGNWKRCYPDYLGCCNRLDYNVGRLMDTLKEQGIEDNTVVIYTSDHGSHFKTRNSEYKRSCHDASIRIPMIAYGPGFYGGKVVKELVSLMDIPPTLLSCAKMESNSMRGESLQKLLQDEASEWPEEVFIQISETQVGRAIRTKRWKYAVRALDKNGRRESSSDVYTEDYLYDLASDPHEMTNLVKEPYYMNMRAELAERLKRCMNNAGEKVPEILPMG